MCALRLVLCLFTWWLQRMAAVVAPPNRKYIPGIVSAPVIGPEVAIKINADFLAIDASNSSHADEQRVFRIQCFQFHPNLEEVSLGRSWFLGK